MSSTFAIYKQPYLDKYNECYKNIITINTIPSGPLASLLHRVQFHALSHFQRFDTPCSKRKKCGLALKSFSNCGHLMTVDELPDLYSFLLSNGYKIDTSLTKMTNNSNIMLTNGENNGQLICFSTFSTF